MTVTTLNTSQHSRTATYDTFDRAVPVGAQEWTVIDGVPGVWRRILNRVAVSARASDGVYVDGRRLDGLQVLRSDADRRPSQVAVGQHVLRVVEGPETAGGPVLQVSLVEQAPAV
jgi:hypothetical protein